MKFKIPNNVISLYHTAIFSHSTILLVLSDSFMSSKLIVLIMLTCWHSVKNLLLYTKLQESGKQQCLRATRILDAL